MRINENRESEIHVAERSNNSEEFDFTKTKVVFTGSEISRVSFWPDGESLAFDYLNKDRLYEIIGDVHRLYLSDKRKEPVTRKARAQEASVSLDGLRLVLVKVSAGKTELCVTDLNGNMATLYSPPPLFRVSRPSFLNNDEIIFTERSIDGKEVIKVFHEKTKLSRIVFGQHQSAQNITVTPHGVLFVSGRSGTNNLYWSPLSLAEARAVTSTTTAISTGTYDHARGQLYFSQLTGKGYFLTQQKFPVEDIQPAYAEALIKSPEYKWTEPDFQSTMTRSDYTPTSYLWPQYWIPLAGLIEGGWAASALTSATDPLGQHAYFIAGNYDSLTNKVGADFRYDYQAGDGVLSGFGGINHRYYYAYDLTASSSVAELRYSFFPSRETKKWSLGARASRQTTEIPGSRLYEYAGPGGHVTYNDSSQKATEISPSSGINTTIDYQHYVGSWGNVDFGRTRFSLTGYHSKWLPKRNVLALDLNAYLSPRNRSIYLGTSAGGDYSLTFLTTKSILIRGYPVGEFLGWNMASGSLEYRFPISDTPMDWSTFPTLLRRWHAAFFLDTITAEGFYYARDVKGARSTYVGSFFYGTGLEIRSDVTLAYHMPAMLRLGLYYGLNTNAYGGFGLFLSLSLPQF